MGFVPTKASRIGLAHQAGSAIECVDDIRCNDRRIGPTGYRDRLVDDVAQIPDLRFDIGMLIAGPPCIASRLRFDCTPTGAFLGLGVDGCGIAFAETVVCRFRDDRIEAVRSVIDKAAIEARLLA